MGQIGEIEGKPVIWRVVCVCVCYRAVVYNEEIDESQEMSRTLLLVHFKTALFTT